VGRSGRLLVIGWALLLAAWLIGNPPFAAPDERDHYVRTTGIAGGQLVGDPAPELTTGATPTQVAWTRPLTRRVSGLPGLAPPLDCYLRTPRRPARCIETAPPTPPNVPLVTVAVGIYQPLPYLLPAAVVRLGNSPQEALRWARIPGAITALALLALAVALTGGGAGALLGVAVAATPMALFTGASLSGSGGEIAAGIAFAAGTLRLARGGPPSPRWVWVAVATAGAILALSRSTGPLWIALIAVMGLALTGPREARARVRAGGRAAAATGALLVGAVVANRVWESLYGPKVDLGTQAIGLGIRNGLDRWLTASQELVGSFGYLEFRLPLWLPLVWLAVLVGLVAAGWAAANHRERRVLGATAVAAITLPVVLDVLVIRRTGFAPQGRHVLPVLAALPLLAGDLAKRHGRSGRPAVTAAAYGALAVVHLCAFFLNGRRSAVGIDGPLAFVPDAAWSPPLGWVPVLALAGVGALAIAAVGVDRTTRRTA